VKNGGEDREELGLIGPQPSKVVALAWAKQEARELLPDWKYWRLVRIVKRLADFGNKHATSDLRIAPFGEFWALKLKGGIFGKLNLRVYFAHVEERGEVVILMTYKKEAERRVSPHVMVSLEDRLEEYLAGGVAGVSTYDKGTDAERGLES
jgi:hypothetical protein